MLVKCPRCGFSQPQDKYCAQCGVDMETFTPPRTSVVKRYIKDPLLYLAVALVVVGISIFTLYRNDKSDLAQRVRFLKGNTLQIASTSGQERHVEEAAPVRAVASEQSVQKEEALGAPVAPAAVAAPTAETAPAATKAAATSGERVARVYYAEVPQAALERLYEESQATGQFNTFGDYTAGILPEMQKRITAAGLKIRILEKTEKAITKNQHWFSGIRDPYFDEDLGLTTFIELGESDAGVFRGNLEIVRSLREAGERAGVPAGIQKNSYPAIFELGPGFGFFVAGVLPRKTHFAHEEALAAKGPFEILKSQSFQNKQSEFVIFIEFEKKP